jgi:pimeloyl-ACP methyl ester carboxylesterase
MASIPVSEEQLAPLSTGVELCYQTFGDPAADPLILVMGLGGPMIWWDDALCSQLADAGFFVIRYDNRDTGRSAKLREHRVTRNDLVKAFVGRGQAPYSLSDMAADALALLDHLAIDSAHFVGVSMGGMISQSAALLDRSRVRSLTSISSTTGNRLVGWQHPKLLPGLLARSSGDREGYVKSSADFWKLISSPGYPGTRAEAESRAADTWDRGFSASGVLRHMVAVLTQPNRVQALQQLDLPALVIHGTADVMVHPSGGRDTAKAIPGATSVFIPRMGHDLPTALFPRFVEAIREVADRAR